MMMDHMNRARARSSTTFSPPVRASFADDDLDATTDRVVSAYAVSTHIVDSSLGEVVDISRQSAACPKSYAGMVLRYTDVDEALEMTASELRQLLEKNERIISIDGVRVSTVADVERRIALMQDGKTTHVRYVSGSMSEAEKNTKLYRRRSDRMDARDTQMFASRTLVLRKPTTRVPAELADLAAHAIVHEYPKRYVEFLQEFVSATMGSRMRDHLVNVAMRLDAVEDADLRDCLSVHAKTYRELASACRGCGTSSGDLRVLLEFHNACGRRAAERSGVLTLRVPANLCAMRRDSAVHDPAMLEVRRVPRAAHPDIDDGLGDRAPSRDVVHVPLIEYDVSDWASSLRWGAGHAATTLAQSAGGVYTPYFHAYKVENGQRIRLDHELERYTTIGACEQWGDLFIDGTVVGPLTSAFASLGRRGIIRSTHEGARSVQEALKLDDATDRYDMGTSARFRHNVGLRAKGFYARSDLHKLINRVNGGNTVISTDLIYGPETKMGDYVRVNLYPVPEGTQAHGERQVHDGMVTADVEVQHVHNVFPSRLNEGDAALALARIIISRNIGMHTSHAGFSASDSSLRWEGDGGCASRLADVLRAYVATDDEGHSLLTSYSHTRAYLQGRSNKLASRTVDAVASWMLPMLVPRTHTLVDDIERAASTARTIEMAFTLRQHGDSVYLTGDRRVGRAWMMLYLDAMEQHIEGRPWTPDELPIEARQVVQLLPDLDTLMDERGLPTIGVHSRAMWSGADDAYLAKVTSKLDEMDVDPRDVYTIVRRGAVVDLARLTDDAYQESGIQIDELHNVTNASTHVHIPNTSHFEDDPSTYETPELVIAILRTFIYAFMKTENPSLVPQTPAVFRDVPIPAHGNAIGLGRVAQTFSSFDLLQRSGLTVAQVRGFGLLQPSSINHTIRKEWRRDHRFAHGSIAHSVRRARVYEVVDALVVRDDESAVRAPPVDIDVVARHAINEEDYARQLSRLVRSHMREKMWVSSRPRRTHVTMLEELPLIHRIVLELDSFLGVESPSSSARARALLSNDVFSIIDDMSGGVILKAVRDVDTSVDYGSVITEDAAYMPTDDLAFATSIDIGESTAVQGLYNASTHAPFPSPTTGSGYAPIDPLDGEGPCMFSMLDAAALAWNLRSYYSPADSLRHVPMDDLGEQQSEQSQWTLTLLEAMTVAREEWAAKGNGMSWEEHAMLNPASALPLHAIGARCNRSRAVDPLPNAGIEKFVSRVRALNVVYESSPDDGIVPISPMRAKDIGIDDGLIGTWTLVGTTYLASAHSADMSSADDSLGARREEHRVYAPSIRRPAFSQWGGTPVARDFDKHHISVRDVGSHAVVNERFGSGSCLLQRTELRDRVDNVFDSSRASSYMAYAYPHAIAAIESKRADDDELDIGSAVSWHFAHLVNPFRLSSTVEQVDVPVVMGYVATDIESVTFVAATPAMAREVIMSRTASTHLDGARQWSDRLLEMLRVAARTNVLHTYKRIKQSGRHLDDVVLYLLRELHDTQHLLSSEGARGGSVLTSFEVLEQARGVRGELDHDLTTLARGDATGEYDVTADEAALQMDPRDFSLVDDDIYDIPQSVTDDEDADDEDFDDDEIAR